MARKAKMGEGDRLGRAFRVATYGESHGDAVGAVIEGCPPGIEVPPAVIQRDLDRRKPSDAPGSSARSEPDKVEILSGFANGRTTGEPIHLRVRNRDARPSDYDEILRRPRPGHGDMTHYLRHGTILPGGGRYSGRETVGRVLAGAVAKRALAEEGIAVRGRVVEVRGSTDFHDDIIMEARSGGDSVGGVVEIVAEGVPPGLGEGVFDKLDADLAKALMSIGSVKGVEIGAGFRSSRMLGSECNDPIEVRGGRLSTRTNNAGGILAGLSNGMPIVCRIAVKPTPSIRLKQDTVDIATMRPAKLSVKGRHDTCVCPRIVPVAEAMVAITIMDHLLRLRASQETAPSLDALRARIGEKDGAIVEAIAERIALADEAGRVKAKCGMPVVAPDVEKRVVDNALRHGRRHGLDDGLVESVIRSVISHSRFRQQAKSPGRETAVDALEACDASWRLPSPRDMRLAVPLSRKGAKTVCSARREIGGILAGGGGKAVVIMGPCSVHDPDEAIEYAGRVKRLSDDVGDRMLLMMRAYVEKSRTGRGWAGFLADPRMDGTGDVQHGIAEARRMLDGITGLGVPVAMEFVNPLTPLYLGDAVSWAAVGARSSASQLHRAMASGLPMPVGFKNAPDGDIGVAVNAILSANAGHQHFGVDHEGRACAVKTRGNPLCHLVLRGGRRPNYDPASVAKAQKALESAGLRTSVMVDCSHGNSGKRARNQARAFRSVMAQIAKGNGGIKGVMLEGNLEGGCQHIPDDLSGFDRSKLARGVSVTDECLGWDETEGLVREGYGKLG